MKILIVFESLFGNTHAVAEAIARGIRSARPYANVDVVAVGSVGKEAASSADLLVVGGPTHNLGMSSATSRRKGAERASEAGKIDLLESGMDASGAREWLTTLASNQKPAAAFSTHTSGFLAGSAAKGFAGILKRKGYHLVDRPTDFVVTGEFGPLAEGELDRAGAWGAELAEVFSKK